MWLKKTENKINYLNCHLETSLTVSGWKEKSVFHLDRINARILKKKRGSKTIKWRRHHRFPREMTSEKWAQKLHTDDASLPRSIWVVLLIGWKFASSNQRNTTRIGALTRHQYRTSVFYPWTSFRGEISGGVAESRRFSSQATGLATKTSEESS